MNAEEIKRAVVEIMGRQASDTEFVMRMKWDKPTHPCLIDRGKLLEITDHLQKTIETQADEIRLLRNVSETMDYLSWPGDREKHLKARAALSAFDSTRDKETT